MLKENEDEHKEHEQDEPNQTRYCMARLVNRWGVTITDATLRHRRGNDPKREDAETFGVVSDNADSPPIDITYQTGVGAPHDYWWVEFTANDQKWRCKNNKWCDLRGYDQGSIVDLVLCGGDEQLRIVMRSGLCSTSVHK